MGQKSQGTGEDVVTRRRVLRSLGAGGVTVATAGCGGLVGGSSTPTTTERSATFLLSTPLSGPYVGVGEYERNGFELAIQHLNEGGGLVDTSAFGTLSGDGILGQTVDGVVEDSQGDADTARSNVRSYVTDQSAAMVCGGVRGSVSLAHRDLADEHGVPYFVGSSLLRSLSGAECSPHVYQETFTSAGIMHALGPVLGEEVASSGTYTHVTTDSPAGTDLVEAINDYFGGSDSPDWAPRGTETVRPGTTDYEQELQSAVSTRPDAVFLNLFGLDATNALSTAADVVGDETQVIVPLLNDIVADAVGEAVNGVLGTTPFDLEAGGEAASIFQNAYIDAYGSAAGVRTAQLLYTQTLNFAAAANRADSLEADAVRSELEGYEYSGVGAQTMQACNHKSTRPVPVVRGENAALGLQTVTEDATAGCDQPPASNCSF